MRRLPEFPLKYERHTYVMRASLTISLLLLLSIRNLYCEPATFEEFKRLSPQQQKALLADQANPLNPKFYRWYWRLGMGEKGWQYKEQERLAMSNNYYGLLNLFSEYQHLTDEFIVQDKRRRHFDKMSATQQTTENLRYVQMQQTASELYPRAIPLIAALAPTPAALALNAEAGNLSGAWHHRKHAGKDNEPASTQGTPSASELEVQKSVDIFIELTSSQGLHQSNNGNEPPVVTQEDLTAMDQDVQTITDKLKKLPKLTTEQQQTAMNELPEDGPHGVFLPPSNGK